MPYNGVMNISDLLSQGVELMMLGMGMVFFILGLLVVVIKSASTLILRYQPVVTSTDVQTNPPTKIDEDVVAAITIAVQRFRAK
jgi:oxaloacetate decarboxylase gamma subunit